VSATAEPVTRKRYRAYEAVPVSVKVRVGGARLSMGRLSELKVGEVIRLDRAVGAPFDLMVGEVVLAAIEPVACEDRVAFKLVIPEDNSDDPDA
jgi:flagellar motor switch/type III secretory pathway protein FliN